MHSTTSTLVATLNSGESVTVIAAEAKVDELARTRSRNIRRPRVAKHQPRLRGEAFDPTKVSRTLSPSFQG